MRSSNCRSPLKPEDFAEQGGAGHLGAAARQGVAAGELEMEAVAEGANDAARQLGVVAARHGDVPTERRRQVALAPVVTRLEADMTALAVAALQGHGGFRAPHGASSARWGGVSNFPLGGARCGGHGVASIPTVGDPGPGQREHVADDNYVTICAVSLQHAM